MQKKQNNHHTKKILIVDDSQPIIVMLSGMLEREGYTDVHCVGSAEEAFAFLGIDDSKQNGFRPVDLILMDIVMPGMDGIQACKQIKKNSKYADIPLLMVSMKDEVESLEMAFDAGAVDYIVKPVQKLELLARVRSSLRLKEEMDRNKEWEKELLEVTCELERTNRQLQRLSFIDALTGIGNRRYLDELLLNEWNRAIRSSSAISFLMIDIDHFKEYNDCCGHQRGDDCLVMVSQAMCDSLKRSGDFVGRYGGEEFAVVLPDTDIAGAQVIAERMLKNIQDLKIKYDGAKISDRVTISIGVASAFPERDTKPDGLLASADEALYKAKKAGRNRIMTASS
jgi:diguanylate cyclase (GGDEF)-like protein